MTHIVAALVINVAILARFGLNLQHLVYTGLNLHFYPLSESSHEQNVNTKTLQ